MARRKKGRPVQGWLVIDKPQGMTSAAVVNKVKWLYKAQKAGHAGTLDPEATGLLAIAFGEATKTVPYVTDAHKAYRFTVRLGAATNTDDQEGEITKTSDLRPSTEDIARALDQFRGDIQQVPPQFSAVKIDGQRAYKRAREGEDMEIAARPLHIAALEIVARDDADHVTLEMECGKGGYVRSVARDLGEALGCYGHVHTLRRIWAGPFDGEDMIVLEDLIGEAEGKAPEDLDQFLIPVEAGLEGLPELSCTPQGAHRMTCGNPGMVQASSVEYGAEAWASYQGRAVAIGQYRSGELHPFKVFAWPDQI